ncbi:COG3503 Predicted membrane protein [Rhabdaerophilaceae bacterium]
MSFLPWRFGQMTQQPQIGAPRLGVIDLARGVAVLAMIVYHFGWDLSFLGLIENEFRQQVTWVWFGRAIAASFLVLVGFSLVLAHERGVVAGVFLRRLARVSCAALLVSLGTYLIFPQKFVFFGILHAIAVSSVLAWPFLSVPTVWIGLAVILIAVASQVIESSLLNAPWFVWLGLSSEIPATLDFVPIFPWFAFVLVGIGLARVIDLKKSSRPRIQIKTAVLLVWMGRNSLVIYLVHQLVFLGSLWLLTLALAPSHDPQAQGFLSSCQNECRANGGDGARCVAICYCAVEGLKTENLWSSALSDKLGPAEQLKFQVIARRCAENPSYSTPR